MVETMSMALGLVETKWRFEVENARLKARTEWSFVQEVLFLETMTGLIKVWRTGWTRWNAVSMVVLLRV